MFLDKAVIPRFIWQGMKFFREGLAHGLQVFVEEGIDILSYEFEGLLRLRLDGAITHERIFAEFPSADIRSNIQKLKVKDLRKLSNQPELWGAFDPSAHAMILQRIEEGEASEGSDEEPEGEGRDLEGKGKGKEV